MKIIIADDHDLVRTGLSQIIKSHFKGSETIEASNSQDILVQDAKTIDLLLLDLDMPGIGHVRQVKKICVAMPSTAVVIISGNESAHIMQACMEAGAMGFIPKSSSNLVMLRAIELVLSGEPYVPYTFIKQQQTPHKPIQQNITPRQEEIWRLLLKGLSNKAIADELNLTEGTIKQHLSTLYKSLNIHSRLEAVQKAKELWG